MNQNNRHLFHESDSRNKHVALARAYSLILSWPISNISIAKLEIRDFGNCQIANLENSTIGETVSKGAKDHEHTGS